MPSFGIGGKKPKVEGDVKVDVKKPEVKKPEVKAEVKKPEVKAEVKVDVPAEPAAQDERIIIFERSMMGSESAQEFALPAIQALSVTKKMTGERIEVAHSGTKAEITNMQHGQADSITRAFHQLRREMQTTPATHTVAPPPDPMEQLQKLAQLRDQGILTADEFEAKKAEILKRM